MFLRAMGLVLEVVADLPQFWVIPPQEAVAEEPEVEECRGHLVAVPDAGILRLSKKLAGLEQPGMTAGIVGKSQRMATLLAEVAEGLELPVVMLCTMAMLEMVGLAWRQVYQGRAYTTVAVAVEVRIIKRAMPGRAATGAAELEGNRPEIRTEQVPVQMGLQIAAVGVEEQALAVRMQHLWRLVMAAKES